MSQTFPIVLVSAIGSARAAYDPGLAEPARRALVLPSARPRLAPMISRTTTGTCGQKGVLKARRTSSGREGVDVMASPPFLATGSASASPTGTATWPLTGLFYRTEERRVGTGGVRTCRYR